LRRLGCRVKPEESGYQNVAVASESPNPKLQGASGSLFERIQASCARWSTQLGGYLVSIECDPRKVSEEDLINLLLPNAGFGQPDYGSPPAVEPLSIQRA